MCVEVERVVAFVLVLNEHRHLCHVQVPGLPVVLTGNRPKVDDLKVFSQRQDDGVDVRKLIPRGVHREVIRVALELPRRGVDGRHRLPRSDNRNLRVERPIVLELEQVHPVVVALVRRQLIDHVLAGVLRNELLKVMLRRKQTHAPQTLVGMPAQGRSPCQHVSEEEVGIRECDFKCVVVDLRHGTLFAIDRKPRRLIRDELFVLVQSIEPEHEVVSGKRRPVRPAHAFAQEQGQLSTVRIEFPTFGDIRSRLRARVVPEQHVVGT